MTVDVKEEQDSVRLEYGEAIRNKTDSEQIAVNYFFNEPVKRDYIGKKLPVVTDEQFDELVGRRTAEVTSKSVLSAFGLVNPPSWIIDPLKVTSPQYEDADFVRVGSDGKVRSSRVVTSFLLYAQDMMFIYSRTVSLTDGFSDELAASFMYKDITSVALNTVSLELHDGLISSAIPHGKNKPLPRIIAEYGKALFSLPGKEYAVNIGGAKSAMAAALGKLRAQCRLSQLS